MATRKARIFEVVLEDADEQHAPPEQPMLRLATVGSRIFISIVKREGTDRDPTYKKVADIAVSTGAFREAVNALIRAECYDIEP